MSVVHPLSEMLRYSNLRIRLTRSQVIKSVEAVSGNFDDSRVSNCFWTNHIKNTITAEVRQPAINNPPILLAFLPIFCGVAIVT